MKNSSCRISVSTILIVLYNSTMCKTCLSVCKSKWALTLLSHVNSPIICSSLRYDYLYSHTRTVKFSMAYSVGEMWNAGAKSLAVLILIFSGVWPYTKQCITLVLWFLPPTRCSTTRRGKILIWLDVMAKWSMVDIFVLLCTLAAFRISIESPNGLAFLPDGFCKYIVNLSTG